MNNLEGLLSGKLGKIRAKIIYASRDNAVGDAPEWSLPVEIDIIIYRRDVKLPKAKKYGDFAGDILYFDVEYLEWEFGAADACGEEEWLKETNRIEILDIL